MEWCVVDLGNGYCKIKSGNYQGKFKSVLEDDLSNGLNGLKNTVGYKDKFYTVGGNGKYDREFNKLKKNYLPILLLALNNATSQDVNLGLLLPTSLMSFKDEYIKQLQGNRYNYTVDGKKVTKNIKKVIVLSEGSVSYKALNIKKGNTLIIDLGARTFNVTEFDESGNVLSKFTDGIGVFNFYSSIKDKLSFISGESYSEEEIDTLVLNNNKLYTDLSEKNDMLKSFLYDVLGKLKARGIKLGMYENIYMVGGGAELLKPLLKNTPIKVFENKSEYTNALGAYAILKGVK